MAGPAEGPKIRSGNYVVFKDEVYSSLIICNMARSWGGDMKERLWLSKLGEDIHSLCFKSNTVKKRLVSHGQNLIVFA